jgi:VanZ family protein
VGNLPSRGIRVRRERIATAARIGWALLCAFIVYGSRGTWAYQPGIWAPTYISLPDIAVNVLLYVAFGGLGALAMRDRYALARRGSVEAGARHWPRLVGRLVLLAILFSATNEALQLYTIDRVASLTDIGSAAVGALLGGTALAAGRVPR